jgi:prepilin-type N-terminal cleavage/methylation domain-containing protein
MTKGFSLIELLIALSISVSIAATVFQLFRQNERVYRDQDIITDTQQSARAAVFQIADDLRLAGQGVPVFSASFDAAPDETTTVILGGSGTSRINFRAGISNIESRVVGGFPIQLHPSTLTVLTLQDARPFSGARGYLYLWGQVSSGLWGWSRASLVGVSLASSSLEVTPQQTIQFIGTLTASLEEGVSIFYDAAAKTVRRTTATDLSNPLSPTWAPANELAVNVTALSFTYFDRYGQRVTPNTLADRSIVSRVDVSITIQSETSLSTGTRPVFTAHLAPVSLNLSSP